MWKCWLAATMCSLAALVICRSTMGWAAWPLPLPPHAIYRPPRPIFTPRVGYGFHRGAACTVVCGFRKSTTAARCWTWAWATFEPGDDGKGIAYFKVVKVRRGVAHLVKKTPAGWALCPGGELADAPLAPGVRIQRHRLAAARLEAGERRYQVWYPGAVNPASHSATGVHAWAECLQWLNEQHLGLGGGGAAS